MLTNTLNIILEYLNKLNLEQLLELRGEVQKLIDKKEPSVEEILSLGVALEYSFSKTPKKLKKEYEEKLKALKQIYNN